MITILILGNKFLADITNLCTDIRIAATDTEVVEILAAKQVKNI